MERTNTCHWILGEVLFQLCVGTHMFTSKQTLLRDQYSKRVPFSRILLDCLSFGLLDTKVSLC